jgi:hypothetical protein
MQMTICLQQQRIGVQNRVAMTRSNGPAVVQFELQIEIVLLLRYGAAGSVQQGFFVLVISKR